VVNSGRYYMRSYSYKEIERKFKFSTQINSKKSEVLNTINLFCEHFKQDYKLEIDLDKLVKLTITINDEILKSKEHSLGFEVFRVYEILKELINLNLLK